MAKGDLLSPGLGAKHINALVEHGREAFRERFRLLMVNAMQNGYIWFTEPMTPAERQAWLMSPEAEQQAMVQLNDPEAATRAQGAELALAIVEARNGQQTAAQERA